MNHFSVCSYIFTLRKQFFLFVLCMCESYVDGCHCCYSAVCFSGDCKYKISYWKMCHPFTASYEEIGAHKIVGKCSNLAMRGKLAVTKSTIVSLHCASFYFKLQSFDLKIFSLITCKVLSVLCICFQTIACYSIQWTAALSTRDEPFFSVLLHLYFKETVFPICVVQVWKLCWWLSLLLLCCLLQWWLWKSVPMNFVISFQIWWVNLKVWFKNNILSVSLSSVCLK